MSSYNIYIVVDAGTEIGMGHLSRCTAFYDRFTKLGASVMYLLDTDVDYSAFLGDREFAIVNWHNNISLLKQYVTLNDFIFLDSLHISQEQANFISSICKKLVVIDDYLRLNYTNTIILDWTPNVENTGKHFKNSSNNTYLLGAGYAVLREPFASFRYNSTHWSSSQLNILVIMGGSDIRNLTYPIVESLTKMFPDFDIHYIDGRKNPVNAKIMFDMMNEADIVISAAGQTLFELLKLRKPTIAVQVVDNQKEDVQGMLQLGLYDEFYQWDDKDLIDKVLAMVRYLSFPENRKEAILNIKEIDFYDTPLEVFKLLG